MHTLVHQPGFGICFRQHPQNIFLFFFVRRCHALHNKSQRPDMIFWRMGTADAPGVFSLIITGVCLTKNKASRALHDPPVSPIAQIRHGKEAWNVGVIHQVILPEAVHLVGIDFPIIFCFHDTVFFNSLFNLLTKMRRRPFSIP